MKFTIPDSFEIAGRTYEVKYVKKCTDCSDDVTGQVRYEAGVVELVKNIEDCDDATNVDFFHELVHSILFAMRENSRHDEKYCMGIKTKRPNTAICQKCAHLVRDVNVENETKDWINAKTEECPFFEKISGGEK